MKRNCVAAVFTVTAAIMVEKLFSENGIECEIMKIDPAATPNGCSYGVSFPCSQSHSADKILRRSGTEYKILSL